MRVRSLARWIAGLAAVAAFGAAAVIGITAANAEESVDPPASDQAELNGDHWD